MASALVTGRRIKVFIADQDTMAAKLLRSQLNERRNFDAYECASDGASVLAFIRKTRPSVALISPMLRDGPTSGLAVMREARAWGGSVRFVVLLKRAEEHLLVPAFRFGARGVFLRASYAFEDLCKCIRCVHEGQVWADSRQLGLVLDAFSEDPPPANVDPDGLRSLSRRELDVMRLVVEGLSNRQVANQLNLSHHTVKNYVFRMFDKLGVSSRVELVRYALANRDAVAERHKDSDLNGRSGNNRTNERREDCDFDRISPIRTLRKPRRSVKANLNVVSEARKHPAQA